jgi:protein-S-isoprenylcysteine O-methyltransferase Ste14
VWAQFAGLGFVLGVVPWLAWRGDGQGRIEAFLQHDGPIRYVGLLPAFAGAALMLASAGHLGRNLTPATTPVPRGELVVHGLYAWVRHPIYTGLILLYWGLAWSGSNWRLGILTGLGAWAFFDRKASVEEAKLRVRFPEYSGYAARVPKLMPRLRR